MTKEKIKTIRKYARSKVRKWARPFVITTVREISIKENIFQYTYRNAINPIFLPLVFVIALPFMVIRSIFTDDSIQELISDSFGYGSWHSYEFPFTKNE